MHNMTRDPERAVVKGPFDGTTFRVKADTGRRDTAGGARFVTIQSNN
jgi:hypothetical protein